MNPKLHQRKYQSKLESIFKKWKIPNNKMKEFKKLKIKSIQNKMKIQKNNRQKQKKKNHH